ncbi:MAG: hypothetical protein MUF38_02550 [Anaerolineae bacterium]|jgi:hypothetical protein|nr:hypothetical protein [Anaerolineae bacterium]
MSDEILSPIEWEYLTPQTSKAPMLLIFTIALREDGVIFANLIDDFTGISGKMRFRK